MVEEDDFNPNQLININDDKNNNKNDKNFFNKIFSSSTKNSSFDHITLAEEETNENNNYLTIKIYIMFFLRFNINNNKFFIFSWNKNLFSKTF